MRTLRAWRDELPRGRARGRGSSATTSASAGSGTLYLAYCEAGFAERRIHDVQMLLAKPRFRDEPLALMQVAVAAAAA